MAKTYEDAVKLLTSAGKFHICLGLERMQKILQLLDNPQDKLDCIHIAGTNGKGSVCAILSSILTCEGKRVGMYTSPHIFKYTERIQTSNIPCRTDVSKSPAGKTARYSDLVPISDNDFAGYVFEISELADKNGIDLTEFEILTAVMFKYFADKKVEVAVIETGLGGRFDATNVIKKNLCSVITHVDYDHTERLGNTLEKIAYEKAGIIKSGCPCVVFEGYEVYKDIADEKCSMLVIISPVASVFGLSLKGTYQQENLSLALAAVETVFPRIPKNVIDEGLHRVKHICRFQYIPELNLIIDGAHNPNGIEALKKSLDAYYPDMKRRFIFGCLKNKDYKKMVNILFNPQDEVYFYQFRHPNSCPVSSLQEVSPVPAKEFSPDTVINFEDGKITIICGSFYMISDLADIIPSLRNIS